jgi:hypothetical protein
MTEISMATIGPACDAIQDSARALNIRHYADGLAEQLKVERSGNALANQFYSQQQNPLALQNQLGSQLSDNYRGGTRQ